jgi:acetyl-CoA carboxylase biotin carboxyl carrier protein
MDIREIKKILEMMKENDLAEFELEDQGFRLAVKRRSGVEAPVIMAAAPLQASPVAVAAAPAPAAPVRDEDADLGTITAPIVGTFYRSPAPDAEPFVTVGQEVDENTVVCIVEAMKVMNEIKAECRGIIRKILVENATAVQFGQALFKVEPL